MRKGAGILSEKEIDKNFRLMIVEVIKQVEDTVKVLEKPDPNMVSKINARDDYIDNLKGAIENKCYYISLHHKLNKKALDLARAINIIGNNLERIADYAVSIVSQTGYLDDPKFIRHFEYQLFFNEVLQALQWIVRALKNRDMNLALKICRTEINLDNLFKNNLKIVIERLRLSEDTENLVTVLFIVSYLERMGDAILNIGEAVIFATAGEKLKIHDFEALEDSIKNHGMLAPMSDLSIQSIWGTRSGCHISRVENKNGKNGKFQVIFKEGKIKKLAQEYKNILAWEKIYPGLPPKVFNFHKKGENASILIQYLYGKTIQQAILDAKSSFLNEALAHLKRTLLAIWKQTKNEKPTNAFFVRQLHSRLDDVFKIHPGFEAQEMSIGSVNTFSLKNLLISGSKLEDGLAAPFSVQVHGDLNTDNIIYNRTDKKIHFIDFYRSGSQDYVQDLSAFLVSNFRQPLFESHLRSRLNRVIEDFFNFGKKFARKNGDATYEARLALGLARFFLTSTRFEFHGEFAEAMRSRSVYLLEKLVEHKGQPWQEFNFPRKVLYY